MVGKNWTPIDPIPVSKVLPTRLQYQKISPKAPIPKLNYTRAQGKHIHTWRHDGLLLLFTAAGPIIKMREVRPQPVTTGGFLHWSHSGLDTSKTNCSERKLSADTGLEELYPDSFCCHFPSSIWGTVWKMNNTLCCPWKAARPTPFLEDWHPLVYLPPGCWLSLVITQITHCLHYAKFSSFVSTHLFHLLWGFCLSFCDTGVSFCSVGCPRIHCVSQAKLRFVAIFLTQSTKCWDFPHLAICLLNLREMRADKKTKKVSIGNH